jgi:hypothetical protein
MSCCSENEPASTNRHGDPPQRAMRAPRHRGHREGPREKKDVWTRRSARRPKAGRTREDARRTTSREFVAPRLVVLRDVLPCVALSRDADRLRRDALGALCGSGTPGCRLPTVNCETEKRHSHHEPGSPRCMKSGPPKDLRRDEGNHRGRTTLRRHRESPQRLSRCRRSASREARHTGVLPCAAGLAAGVSRRPPSRARFFSVPFSLCLVQESVSVA